MPEQATKILLVEDDDLDVFMLQRLMKQHSLDYPIIRAANGEEALAILKSEDPKITLVPPYIMLLDINMPLMNGFELLEFLQCDERFSSVPVYVLSTSTSEHDRGQVRQYDVVDYMVKPMTAQRLKNILNAEQPIAEAKPLSSQPPEPVVNFQKELHNPSAADKKQDLFLHDMKGPIVNARGFANMSVDTLDNLRLLIEENSLGMSAEQVHSAHNLVIEDLQPYLAYLCQTIVTMEERIHRYQEQ